MLSCNDDKVRAKPKNWPEMTVDKLQTRSKNKRLNKKRNKKSEWKKAVVEIRVQDQTTVEEAKMMQPNSISGTEEQRQQPGHARKQELLLRSRSKVRKLRQKKKKKRTMDYYCV